MVVTYVVTRSCVMCGELERGPNNQPIYYLADRIPNHHKCNRCGSTLLMPDYAERRVVRVEPPVDWTDPKPRIGRPPKALTEARKREAERLGLSHTGSIHRKSKRIPE